MNSYIVEELISELKRSRKAQEELTQTLLRVNNNLKAQNQILEEEVRVLRAQLLKQKQNQIPELSEIPKL